MAITNKILAATMIFAVFILAAAAYADNQTNENEDSRFNSQYNLININLSSFIDITSTGEGETSRVDSIVTDVYFIPKEFENQKVLYLQTQPDGQLTQQSARFSWESPRSELLQYSINGKVRVENKPPMILSKVHFPIDILDVPDEYRIYLKPSEKIDSNDPEIKSIAKNIVADNDDLWVVASKLAIWTKNNIQYNLSTLTENVVQNASWTLKQREGVCDEISTLYIAMLRSLGVPAKYVSGIAYTNNGAEKWEGHGWTEVYFPQYGWVPFDPTLGEYGWINPTHIKMMESADPTEPSTNFEWKGKNVNVHVRPLDINAELVESGEQAEPMLLITAQLFKTDVGFGSYNLITATIENPQPFYVTSELKLAKVEEVSVEGEQNKQVIMPPKSKRNEFWIVKIDPDLQRDTSYKMPLMIYTVRNESSTVIMSSTVLDHSYDLSDVTHAQALAAEQEAKAYSSSIDMQCQADKPFMYDYEQINITCTLQNNGNLSLKKTEVCVEKQCKETDLVPGKKETVILPVPYLRTGLTELLVSASHPNATRAIDVAVDFRDAPGISIDSLKYPQTADYNSDFDISFELLQQSISVPNGVKVSLTSNTINRTAVLESFIKNQTVLISLAGSELETPSSKFTITASWKDSNEKEYTATQDFRIMMGKMNWMQKVYLFFRDFFINLKENF